MATKKEEVILPGLNAAMLADLMADFYRQPGVEEAYQQWLAERRAEKKRKKEMHDDHLPRDGRQCAVQPGD